ncbi:MAG: hypothetical protein NVSMB27_23980 [Ktedonobacteraceae bacterium]
MAVSSQQMFPAAPFPRKYVRGVFDDLHDAVQAVQALRAAGYDARDIHVMASWDFVEAVERGYQQQGSPSKTLIGFLPFLDDGFVDVYLREARRGRHILAIRPSRYEQIGQVRDLLAANRAHLVKYVDTWTAADLLP